jgi:hypothetical protein
LVGGIVGAAVGIAVTYGVLSGQGVDALVWAVTFVLFGFVGGALGVGAALALAGHVRDRKTKSS